MRSKKLWISLLFALTLIFTMAFSNMSAQAAGKSSTEKKYIVGFKQTMSAMSSAKKRMLFLRKAEKSKSSLSMLTQPQQHWMQKQ